MISTAQFHAAIARHIDETKPDPLAKRQLERISLRWKEDEEDEEEKLALRNQRQQQQNNRTSLVNGVLTLSSSEYISIVIRVVCEFRVSSLSSSKTALTTASDDKIAPNEDGATSSIQSEDALKSFDDEFYFQLIVHAKLKSKSLETTIADENDDNLTMKKKTREQQCKMEHKLHLGMTNRLQSDVSVRRLLLLPDIDRSDNHTANNNCINSSNIDEGITLCEALIQRNRTTQSLELEERVNVDESILDGVRSAIYSHAEDNLDVLELLLNMPYLPRIAGGFIFPLCNNAKGRGGEVGDHVSSSFTSDDATTMTIINELAQRAYMRLLEDAMFDACEKEGEDELLDDLTIT